MPPTDDERRRFSRAPADAAVEIVIAGAALPCARVVDVSLGGVLVELAAGAVPPALGAAALTRVLRSGIGVERRARVVRVRWGGRERGAAVPPAAAFAFDDDDAEAAARLHALLGK